jgi:diguanylate cyclase (GGDEF)-like protein
VAPSDTSTLTRLARRRFQNFSEAAEVVLSALADVIPGTVLLGRLEPDEHVCRVMDMRGAGVGNLKRGAVLPVTAAISVGGMPDPARGAAASPPVGAGLDLEFLGSLGARTSLTLPLETSDGIIVGVLCALDSSAGAYRSEHTALLGIAAVLLSHEWESVQRRAELRRLRARLASGPNTDADTGFVNRDGFLELLDREWRLVARGTVESALVACSVEVDVGDGPDHAAVKNVALKVAADVLSASVRGTDHVGRVGPMEVAVILVGCQADEASVFVERFESALGRVTQGGHPKVEISYSIQSLTAAPPPAELLKFGEAAARALTAQHPAQGVAG